MPPSSKTETVRARLGWKLTFGGLCLVASFIVAVELQMGLGVYRPSFELFPTLNVELDREFLFRYRPHSNAQINSHGYRDVEWAADKGSRKRLLFLGDSFVAGLNVPPHRTIPKVLEQQLGTGFEVFNMGTSGYGPDQSLMRLLDDGLGWNPDGVILGIYASNDFHDVYKNELFRVTDKGALKRTPRSPVASAIPSMNSIYFLEFLASRFGWQAGQQKYRDLFKVLFRDRTDYELLDDPQSEPSQAKRRLMLALMEQFRNELERRDVELLVVIIPALDHIARLRESDRAGPSHDDLFAEICERLGIRHVLVYPEFGVHPDPLRLYEGADPHLSPEGCALVAAQVKSNLAY